MLNASSVIVFFVVYMGLLFAVAYWVEHQARCRGSRLSDNPVVYALSLAVYCTSWTYYGSVGKAVTSGPVFLSVYLGATLTLLLGWVVLRKLVRIKTKFRISSIADFISARFNRSGFIASLVTVGAIVGTVPYIALQLKAVLSAFDIITVHKANVLDVSQLWRDQVNAMAAAYPGVELSHMYVDNAAMQLVRNPRQFDVLLTSNLFGDILSDEAAMLSGSIGMLPSASLGSSGPGLFEPIHGSAPDIAGQDRANPLAMVLSAAMMLRLGLGENGAATALEAAVDRVLAAGFRTGDLMAPGCTELGCRAMGDRLLASLEA